MAGKVYAGGDPKSGANAAGVVAELHDGTLLNCVNLADVTGVHAGGVAGTVSTSATAASPARMVDCYNAGSVTAAGENSAGGLASSLSSSSSTQRTYLLRCGNSGVVTALQTQAGGIAATVTFSSLEECWNTGAVSAQDYVGGLVGRIAMSSILLTNCYNAGRITGLLSASAGCGVGGLIVLDRDSGGDATGTVTATNVFNAGQVSAGNGGTPTGALLTAATSYSKLTNAHYLAGTAAQAIGSGAATGSPNAVSVGELRTLHSALGDAFCAGSPYPILTSQAGGIAAPLTAVVAVTGGTSSAQVAGIDLRGALSQDEGLVTLDLTTGNTGIAKSAVVLTQASLAALADETKVHRFQLLTDVGSAGFAAAALDGILNEAGSGDVTFTIAKLTSSGNSAVQALINSGQTVYESSLTAGNSAIWTEGGTGSVVLSLPFTRTGAKTTITLSRIAGDGAATAIECGYDSAVKRISFTADRLGFYAVKETEYTPQPGGSGSGNVKASIWDGYSVDVSWFDKSAYDRTDSYYISTPAQLAGLAALVNGIYNKEIDTFAGDISAIVDNVSESGDSSGPNGNNMSTDKYHYGNYDFNGKTVYLTADIDMSKGNYMPIGGQYLMTKNDYDTKIGASFCGVLDGQGHDVTILCDRHCSTGNYGDGASVGLIGRLGVHDNDDVGLRPSGAGVYNLAVYGEIYANRSVGGIVGKIGKTADGGTIENCANFATVHNTDAKGVGGIVGAGWNGGIVRNCYNAGTIYSTFSCPTGGISGSNEIPLENCYSVGTITAPGRTYAMGIGTNNSGAPMSVIQNCWYLEGSASGGGYYTNNKADNSGAMTAVQMKGETFLNALGKAFAKDTKNQNNGYPVLAWQNTSAPTGTGDPSGLAGGESTSLVTIESTTTVTNGKAATTVTEKAVTAGIAAAAAEEKGLVIRTDTNGKSAASTTVSVPRTSAQEIAKATLELTLQTADNSRVTLTPAALASIAGQAGGGALEITVNGETRQAAADIVSTAKNLDGKDVDLDSNPVVSVTVQSGGKEISSFTGSMAIDLPVDSAKYTEGQSYKVIQISAGGSVETLTGVCVKVDGVLYVRVTVSHLSTFIVTAVKAFAGYDDVKPGAWYYDAVAYVTEKSLMGSTGGNRFSPETDMTRAMLVTVLYRLEGSPAVTAESSFTDVASGQWYTDAVRWASANKIVDGYGNGLFGTNDSVTRQQIAAILYRYAALKGYDVTKAADLTAYTDASGLADWARSGMAWANAAGLITGRTETALVPGGTASRAEVATMLMRLAALIVQ